MSDEAESEDLFAEFTRLRRELSRLRARASSGTLDPKGRARLRFVQIRADACVERLRARRRRGSQPATDTMSAGRRCR